MVRLLESEDGMLRQEIIANIWYLNVHGREVWRQTDEVVIEIYCCCQSQKVCRENVWIIELE